MSTLTRPARRRILDAATELFYAEGVRAVGIDRIIAEASVAKATFYHHFPGKDDLVRTYIEEQSHFQCDVAARIPEAAPRDMIQHVFGIIGEIACGPGFHGCPFINAAAEYTDPSHPVRQAIADHRRWFHAMLYGLLLADGHPDAARTADMLVVLRDGFVVGGHLDDPAAVRALVRQTVTRVLEPPATTA